jgi:hypothetical protein
MRHTCCTPARWRSEAFEYSDVAEVQEFHEEHAESIEQFEALLPAVIEEYRASGLELMAYLEGPCTARVVNLWEAEYDTDEEYLDSVFENTGVRLDRDFEEITDGEDVTDTEYE